MSWSVKVRCDGHNVVTEEDCDAERWVDIDDLSEIDPCKEEHCSNGTLTCYTCGCVGGTVRYYGTRGSKQTHCLRCS